MRALRFILLSALFIFVGLPCLFALFVLVGILLVLVKIALMVIVPVAVLMWLFNRMTCSERVY